METNMYMSIRKVSKTIGLGETYLRERLKRNGLPGRMIRSHFKVNVPLLIEELTEEDRNNRMMQSEKEVHMSE